MVFMGCKKNPAKKKTLNISPNADILIQYLRDDDDKPYGMIVAEPLTDTDGNKVICIGMSVCHTRHDAFDRQVAYDLAKKRIYAELQKDTPSYEIPAIPEGCRFYPDSDEYFLDPDADDPVSGLAHFMNRCVRYYKDKRILYPHVKFIDM